MRVKRRLGVSIYPDHSDFKTDVNYLRRAASYGFERVFMSMLEVEGGREKTFHKFYDIIQKARELGFEVMLDIAPNIFDDLGISYQDLSFFSELGADGLRLDVGFNGSREALLSYNPYGLIIELNMSNDVAYLENILSYEANKPFIYGCHNFYPQKGSALPLDFFNSCSKRFKNQGIRTAAFVTSQSGKMGPWEVTDGLPTLEMHRYLPIDIQTKHLFATGLIDDVIIGNAYATDEELKKMSEVNKYQLIFNVELLEDTQELEKEILFDNQHFRRGDITDLVIRSTNVRVKYKELNREHDNGEEFVLGDILIGNKLFGQYNNELQIALLDHSDERKNKVGRIKLQEQFLLDYVKPWSKFKFEYE